MTAGRYSSVATDEQHEMNMQPVTGQPVAATGQPLGLAAPKMWKSGLCDCFATGANLCCNVFWCYPCMAGRVHSAMADDHRDHMNVSVCSSLILAQVVTAGLTVGLPLATHGAVHVPGANMIGACAVFGYTWWQRHTLSKKLGIQGDMCGDCMISYFCSSCALCQHHTELVQHGVNPGSCCCEVGEAPAGVQPAYPMTN
eukprot:TRINITY_DN1166_c0_g1_i1.p1 TRINITY_DN1166_c0_g1~~TRINITY_DN1166_c0_g1_i1.p1  ORF type:complete len:199 (+),score=43.84 TRINITY_DN1166_c0_g1_i1:90-686(+)